MPTKLASLGFNEFVSVSTATIPFSSIFFIHVSSSLFFKTVWYFFKSNFSELTFSFSSYMLSPYCEITWLSNLLNSISLKKSYSFCFSIFFKSKVSNFCLTGTSSFNITNLRLKIALFLFSIIVSLLFFWGISCAFYNTLSKVLYLLINSAAVLIPIPGTPGTLSEESPAKAWTSITLLGSTPNFSLTSLFPKTLLFIGS